VRAVSAAPANDVIRLVIVEPAAVFRLGLGHALDSERDMEVVAEAGTVDDGLKAIKRLGSRSKVVVLIGLEANGEHDAFSLVHTVRELFPSHRVLVMGTDIDGVAISRAFFVGADGFVHKDCEPAGFVDAVRRTAVGGIVLEGLPRGALGGIAEAIDFQRTAILTPRETQVLAVAAEGLTARQIGRRLGMRERTVTTHLAHIYRKLGTNSRVAAVMAASKSGLLLIPSAREEEEENEAGLSAATVAS
jgi:DNA-binding NarL/FixJ family response regulator